MIEVGEARPDQLAWVEEKTGCVLTRNARGLVALRAGQVVGMVAYDHWSGNSCRMTLAVDGVGPLRRLLRPMFDYPFRHVGKSVLLTFIPSHSAKYVSLAEGLGFQLAHVIEDGCKPGDSLLQFEMRKADCRWLEGGP